MLKKTTLFCLFLAIAFPFCSQAREAGCQLPNGSMLNSPSQGKPVVVKISNFVLNVESVDDQEQQFTSDFIVDYIWTDPRLGAIASQAQGPCIFQLDNVWNPAIQLFNIRRLNSRLPERVKVLPNGEVTYTQRFYGTLSSPLDLKEFPFDRQTLPYIFISLYDNNQVVLQDNPKMSGQDAGFSIAGWSNAQLENTISEYQPQTSDSRYQQPSHVQLNYHFSIDRDVMYYRWKVMLPLSLIVISA